MRFCKYMHPCYHHPNQNRPWPFLQRDFFLLLYSQITPACCAGLIMIWWLSCLSYFTSFRISHNWDFSVYFLCRVSFAQHNFNFSFMLLNVTIVHSLYCWVFASLYECTQFVLCEYISFILSPLVDIWGVPLFPSGNKAVTNSHLWEFSWINICYLYFSLREIPKNSYWVKWLVYV